MEEQLISYETAKLAKEKGFDFSIVPYRDSNTLDLVTNVKDRLSYCVDPFKSKEEEANLIKLPTQSLLQRWLREAHNISIDVSTGWLNDTQVFNCEIWDRYKDCTVILSEVDKDGYFYETIYEKALEQGLQEALKLIKNGRN